jgi:hypothetical protein
MGKFAIWPFSNSESEIDDQEVWRGFSLPNAKAKVGAGLIVANGVFSTTVRVAKNNRSKSAWTDSQRKRSVIKQSGWLFSV